MLIEKLFPLCFLEPEFRTALLGAEAQAEVLGHTTVGTEHLVLAYAADPRTSLGSILAEMSISEDGIINGARHFHVAPQPEQPAPSEEFYQVAEQLCVLAACGAPMDTPQCVDAMCRVHCNAIRILWTLGVTNELLMARVSPAQK